MLQETVSSERHQQLPTVFWNSNRMPFLESYLCVMLVITVSMLKWIFLLHFLCVNRMIRNAKLWWRCVYNNRPRRNTDRSLYGEPKICLWQLVQHISRSSSFIQFDCPAFTVLFRDNAARQIQFDWYAEHCFHFITLSAYWNGILLSNGHF